MRFWWVNHKQTFKEEVGQGFIWSPKTNANGARNQFYENLQLVVPGDVIFSFADTRIQAVGVASGRAESSPKPTIFGNAGDYWNDIGWKVDVDFQLLENPLRPRDYIDLIRPVLPEKYSPINDEGNGNQGAYLAELPTSMVEVLLSILGDDFHNSLALAGGNMAAADEEANEAEAQLVKRRDIPTLEIHQLVKARRGQGIFKTNVRGIEKKCRITQLELPQHLVASHIKPWAKSSDEEKIDGSNGLLLSPHVDHLFDRGFISFKNSGEIILSPSLQYRVLQAWSIDPDANVGSFTSQQSAYLEFHRDVILAG